MRVISILAIFLFALIGSTLAQPGYLGRRFIPYYEGAFMNALIAPNAGHKSFFKDYDNPRDSRLHPLAFNYRHILGLDVVYSRSIVVGVNVQFYNTAVNATESFRLKGSGFGSGDNRVDFEGIIDLKGTNYEVYGKYFWDGYIAPAGDYAKIGLILTHTKAAEPGKTYYYEDDYSGEEVPFEFNRSSMWSPGITTEYGISRIVANRLRFKLALEFNVLYSYLYKVEPFLLTRANYIKSHSAVPIFAMHLLCVKFGVGILADVRELTPGY